MLFRAAAGEYGWNLELRRDRAHVARRLHHPLGVPRQDQGGLRPGPGARRTCCSTRTSATSWAAEPGWRGRSPRPSARHPGARVLARARVLRRLPQRAAPRQPDPGPARLLRRPHVRAGRPPAGEFFHTNWVPVLAADDDEHEVVLTGVPDLARRRRLHVARPPGPSSKVSPSTSKPARPRCTT